jgi:hypothetical protein
MKRAVTVYALLVGLAFCEGIWLLQAADPPCDGTTPGTSKPCAGDNSCGTFTAATCPATAQTVPNSYPTDCNGTKQTAQPFSSLCGVVDKKPICTTAVNCKKTETGCEQGFPVVPVAYSYGNTAKMGPVGCTVPGG